MTADAVAAPAKVHFGEPTTDEMMLPGALKYGGLASLAFRLRDRIVELLTGQSIDAGPSVGAATVAIAWSEYANRVLEWFGLRIPYEWSHSPFERAAGTGVHVIALGLAPVP